MHQAQYQASTKHSAPIKQKWMRWLHLGAQEDSSREVQNESIYSSRIVVDITALKGNSRAADVNTTTLPNKGGECIWSVRGTFFCGGR